MHRYLPLLVAIAMFAGCDIVNLIPEFMGGGLVRESGSSKLIPFESEDDVLDYFRDEITTRNQRMLRDTLMDLLDFVQGAAGGTPIGLPTAPSVEQFALDADGGGDDRPGVNGDFSETTTQEVGVDEADVVKTDGTHLYMLTGNQLRIVRVDPLDALSSVSEIELDGFGLNLYLDGDVAVVLSDGFRYVGGGIRPVEVLEDVVSDGSSTAGGIGEPDTDGVADDDRVSFAPVSRPGTTVTIIDVSDATNPLVRSRTRFDGSMASSRMIDGALYLVTANFQHFYQDVLPQLGTAELDVSRVDLESLLPNFETIDAAGSRTTGDVLTWTDLYHPEDADGFGVVSVVSMGPLDGADFDAVGVVAEPGLIYASREALYLTDTNYDTLRNSRTNTDIYKFALRDGLALPVATGTVPGRVLNQYSMGEHNGYLRVATTVRPTGLSDGLFDAPHNDVFVLDEVDDSLAIVGSITGIAPRETIQSARFIGDRGYVVTFEEVDPLFTLDLSDPADPRIVGELKVPGFSTFIVPMGNNHLLTVGQYIPEDGFFFGSRGVQLSIFDISDFAAPVLAHTAVLGDGGGAYSEALHNPKAFTYFAESGLLTLPVSIFEQGPFFFAEPVLLEDDVDTVRPGALGSDGGGSAGDAEPDLVEEPVDVIIDPITSEPTPPVSIGDPPPDVIDGVPIEPFIRGGFDGLIVYRVSPEAGFSELKRVSTRFEQSDYFSGSYTRGVFVGDNVMAATDIGVRGTAIEPQDETTYEVFFGPRFDDVFFLEPGVDVGVAISVDEFDRS